MMGPLSALARGRRPCVLLAPIPDKFIRLLPLRRWLSFPSPYIVIGLKTLSLRPLQLFTPVFVEPSPFSLTLGYRDSVIRNVCEVYELGSWSLPRSRVLITRFSSLVAIVVILFKKLACRGVSKDRSITCIGCSLVTCVDQRRKSL